MFYGSSGFSFSYNERLHKNSDFKRVFEQGVRLSVGFANIFIFDRKDGKPIKRCPGFWFVAKFDNDDIQSRSFSFGFDTREQNEFQMTQTLRYLQDHKDSLRFVVENVWCDIAAKYNQ